MNTWQHLSPQLQIILTVGFMGMVHTLCISDMWEAYKAGDWGRFLKQLVIELGVSVLSWQVYVLPYLGKK